MWWESRAATIISISQTRKSRSDSRRLAQVTSLWSRDAAGLQSPLLLVKSFSHAIPCSPGMLVNVLVSSATNGKTTHSTQTFKCKPEHLTGEYNQTLPQRCLPSPSSFPLNSLGNVAAKPALS